MRRGWPHCSATWAWMRRSRGRRDAEFEEWLTARAWKVYHRRLGAAACWLGFCSDRANSFSPAHHFDRAAGKKTPRRWWIGRTGRCSFTARPHNPQRTARLPSDSALLSTVIPWLQVQSGREKSNRNWPGMNGDPALMARPPT